MDLDDNNNPEQNVDNAALDTDKDEVSNGSDDDVLNSTGLLDLLVELENGMYPNGGEIHASRPQCTNLVNNTPNFPSSTIPNAHSTTDSSRAVRNQLQRNVTVQITEQPAPKALRFRYECEGRSAGSIPGVNSTPENKTFPSIRVHGYQGRAVVVVSCVTKDPPYRPHPHNLVGRDGCKKGVCTVEINSETMSVTFSNLGIQCVKKKDIDSALRTREEIRVDPYRTGFSHRSQPSSIDLNAVRLCFQVFLEGEQKGKLTVPLQPVVSDPIFDKKAMSDLVICKLSDCTSSVAGGKDIILLCEKVAKEDISVRFFEEHNDVCVWEAYGDFQHTNVHKQVAISFRTPAYRTLDVNQPVKILIQLKRPSDGVVSDALPFELLPLDAGRRPFWSLRRDLMKRKSNTDLFKQILEDDDELSAISVNAKKSFESQNSPPCYLQTNEDVIVLDTPVIEEKALVEVPADARILATYENNNMNVAPALTSENELDKTNDWIQTSEFLNDDALINHNNNIINNNNNNNNDNSVLNFNLNDPHLQFNNSIEDEIKNEQITLTDEDNALNELLEQVAELDEIYSDHQIRRENLIIENELKTIESTLPTQMEIDDVFDDSATYSSLQRAFKNPIEMQIGPPIPPRPQIDVDTYDFVDTNNMLVNPLAPVIDVSLKRENKEEEKLPPLPPKRVKKTPFAPEPMQDKENNVQEMLLDSPAIHKGSSKSLTPRPPSQIIIVKSTEHLPPTKKLPPKPSGNPDSNTLPRQKKPGFFSKLFSRKKSKSDISSPTKDTPVESREPSILHFDLADPNRGSIRSIRSLKPIQDNRKITGKPLGRSASSVSGKRPHITGDVVHIPLKGDSLNSLPARSGSGTHISLPGNEGYERISPGLLCPNDRKTMSALQLADLPLKEGNMELVAIADAQSIKNLCEGEFGLELDPSVDLTEAEHFALYTAIAPHATQSEFDENSCYYAPVEAGEILTPAEMAKRLTNNL